MGEQRDNDLPELLVTLSHELRMALRRMLENMSDEDLNRIISSMMQFPSSSPWGNWFPAASHIDLEELPHFDPVYAALYFRWDKALQQQTDLHPQLQRAVVLNLLGVARSLLGGAYVPKGAPERMERDRQMYNEFNGRNYRELALKYGLTEMRTRQIVDRRLTTDRRRMQRDLFDPSCGA